MTFGEIGVELTEAARLCFDNPASKAVFANKAERMQAAVILEGIFERSVLIVSWEWKCVMDRENSGHGRKGKNSVSVSAMPP